MIILTEYKYNTRTLQCVLEKQERKSVWVYTLDLYVLVTEKRYNMHGLK